MKLRFTILLLVVSIMAHAQQLTAIEYFFDTDPGFGNGSQVAVNTASLDATVDFTTGNLPAGLHVLFVRLKNSANQWSTLYQSAILFTNGAGGASNIAYAEYYFDNDPGFGNGNHITLNGTSIDSTINFDVTGLTPGLHTFSVRLKDTNNYWSSMAQGSFSVSTGTAGVSQIKSLSYFVDSTANSTSKPLGLMASLDTTISIHITDNGSDARKLGLRLLNQTGEWSNATLIDISLCDLYKPEGSFRIAQYGGTFSMIDNSRCNTSGKIHWLADNTLFDSTAVINYKFNNTGAKTITQITGTGCRVDSVAKIITMPGIERYGPLQGSYNSDFTLNLYGAGLDTNMTIFLKKGDTTVYTYMKIARDNNQRLLAVFDFHMYPKTNDYGEIFEKYTLHVVYPDGHEYVGNPGFPIAMQKQSSIKYLKCNTVSFSGIRSDDCEGSLYYTYDQDPDYQITDKTEPYFATDLTGPDDLRAGEWGDFTLSITNTGSVVAKGIPFYIAVPGSFDIDSSKWNIINPYPGLRDSISIITPIDTVINGRHIQYKLLAMIYPVLAPGETGYFPLRVRNGADSAYNIFYTVSRRMFGSPMTDAFGPCWGAVWDFAIGAIPGVGCVYSFGSLINDGVNYHYTGAKPSFFSMGLSVVGTAVSCIPGGGPLKAIAQGFAGDIGFFKGTLSAVEEATYVADKGLGAISSVNGAVTSEDPCSKPNEKGKKKNVKVKKSKDPNSITGNSDYYAATHYINNYSPQQYTISFENYAAATANAQHVYITDSINKGKFIVTSLKISQFSIADSIYTLPPYRTQVTTDVGLKSRKDMKVRFVASFDTATGVLQTDFFSIDTSGHILPASSVDGFLPPNTDGVKGTGTVSYSLYAQSLNTLDTFSNRANIYFDNNAPISTNTWVNTIDTTHPQAAIVNAIRVNDTIVKLVVHQSDIGAGNAYNVLYAKKGTETVFHKMGIAAGDTIAFTGIANQTYQLYVAATDNVGNIQQKETTDISYTFNDVALPVHLLSFNAVKENNRVKLLWTASDETNFSHYEVEKSSDGRSFTKIGTVNSKGGSLTNNYQQYDEHPLLTSNYYRLKQVDKNGTFVYSRVVRIDFDKTFTLAVTPVPAHDYITIDGAENFNKVQLVDMGGRIVKQFSKTPGNIFGIQDIKPGIYIIRLVSDNTIETLKMVKQ